MAIPIKTSINGDAGFLNGPLNKLWRAKILLNRKTSKMSKDSKGATDKQPNPKSKTTKFTEELHKTDRDYIEATGREYAEKGTPLFPENELNPQKITNNIIIINPNVTPPISLVIQGKPLEVRVTPETTWASVKSMGRNNPFMVYTGGEDTLEFEISWFSISKDRRDVIDNCRILESWSKADGYKTSPPTLMISWGNSNLFQDDNWILYSAPYVLSNFQNSCRQTSQTTDEGIGIRRLTKGFSDLGLYPNVATQTLTFKKVTSKNLTHLDIQKPDNQVMLGRNSIRYTL